jgi:hypothetical protein
MQTGIYHAWHADVPCLKVADGVPDSGEPTANLIVFSDGNAGSGLSGPVDHRNNVKVGAHAGCWEPDRLSARAAASASGRPG